MRWKKRWGKENNFPFSFFLFAPLWILNIMFQVYLHLVESVEGWKSLFTLILRLHFTVNSFLLVYLKHFFLFVETTRDNNDSNFVVFVSRSLSFELIIVNSKLFYPLWKWRRIVGLKDENLTFSSWLQLISHFEQAQTFQPSWATARDHKMRESSGKPKTPPHYSSLYPSCSETFTANYESRFQSLKFSTQRNYYGYLSNYLSFISKSCQLSLSSTENGSQCRQQNISRRISLVMS